MNELELLHYWNQGNYEFICQNYDLTSISNSLSAFFYLDSFFQLHYLDKVKILVQEYYNQNSKDVEAIKIKNLFQGKLVSGMGDYEQSFKLINEAHKINFDPHHWIDFNIKLNEALSFFTKNDYKSGLQILNQFEKRVPAFIQVFSKYNTSYFFTLKMLLEWKLGEQQKALESSFQSESINKKFNNEFKLAYDYFIRGQIRVELGEILKGLIDFEEATKLYTKFNNVYGEELVLLAIAEVKYIQGKLSESLAMFQKSVQHFQGNDHLLCDTYYLIGKIHQKKNDLEQAKSYFKRSLEIAIRLKLVFYQNLAIVTMIDLLIQKGDIEEINEYKKLFIEQTDDENIILMRLMTDALILESKQKFKESKDLWILISSNKTLPLALQIYTLEKSLTSCIMIWKQEKEFILLNQIQEIIEKWEKLATDNFLMSSLATIYILKSKFYLAVVQVENARHYLVEGKKIAQKYGLEVDNKEIEKDESKILKLEKIQASFNNKQSENDVELEDILEYLKTVKTNVLIDK